MTLPYVGVTGRLQQLTYPNGQVSTYAYLPNAQDKRLQEIHHRQSSGGATLSRFNYTYDVLGNIGTWQQQYEADTKLWEFGYDLADQLTLAVQKTTGGSPTILKRFSYGYDSAGNRTGLQEDDLARSATFDTMNRLLSTQAGGALRIAGALNEPGTVTVQAQPAEVLPDNRFQGSTSVGTGTTSVVVKAQDPSGNLRTNTYNVSASGGTTSYTYDGNGNLTGDGTNTFEWDAENRLTAVKQGAATLASFVYDGLGRRAQKTAGGVTTTYVYDGDGVIEERLSTGGTLRYVRGPGIDHHWAMRDGSGVVTYFLADHLGSVVQTTNASGSVTLSREYDPYGALLSGTSQSGYAFTGREWDPETNLYYYRARYYDPKLGRFVSEDPIGLAGGLNRYSYVYNSPANWLDPFGLHTLTFDGKGVSFRGDAGEFLGYIPATSGRSGVTDPTVPWKGPIPPGEYTLDPSEITPGNWKRDLAGDWGEWRVPLHPVDPKQIPPGRDPDTFFLHGGKRPGSAGCIDVGKRDRHLFPPLIGHDGPVRVIVK